MSANNLRLRKIVGLALDGGKTSDEVAADHGLTRNEVRRLFIEYRKDRRALQMLQGGTDPVLVAVTLHMHTNRVRRLAEVEPR